MHTNQINLCSLNMHGFSNSVGYLSRLASMQDIIFVQEHWLLHSDLWKFSEIDDNFCFYGKSAMDERFSSGVLNGRPFGGVGVLFRKNLNNIISYCGAHSSGRVIAIKILTSDISLLVFGVYLPCIGTPDRLEVIADALGFIESTIEEHDNCRPVVMGDFNCLFINGMPSIDAINSLCMDLNLTACDDLDCNNVGYSFYNDTAGLRTLIDHVVFPSELLHLVLKYAVLEDGDNLSDHLAISLCINCNFCPIIHSNNRSSLSLGALRWDKGDLKEYYRITFELLSKIKIDKLCCCSDNVCCNNDHRIDIEVLCAEICHCLSTAASLCIPRVRKGSMKHFWCDTLNLLKQDSIDACNMWKQIGKPRSGPIFDIHKDAKYKYKLAYKDLAKQQVSMINDELYVNLANRQSNNFWRKWRSLRNPASENVVLVNGANSCEESAAKFADFFSNIYNTVTLQNTVCDLPSLYSVSEGLLEVEEIDVAINTVKGGKAGGLDGIQVEHIKYAHPLVVLLIKALFNCMMSHSYVPNSFGVGVVVPIPKDRLLDKSKAENYRGITIGSVFGKLFEICLLKKMRPWLGTNERQFGFKPGMSCDHAVLTVQLVVDYFVERKSNVFLSALDACKAFDRVIHNRLFVNMVTKGIPLCIIQCLINWYSKLSACVKWFGCISTTFSLKAGVRQGGVLSPFLFNLYVDDLINMLQSKGYGCHVGNIWIGCIMYADDILLLSPSVAGLQKMLDLCVLYAADVGITFNTTKSMCMMIGSKHGMISCMTLGTDRLLWVDAFKYLGIKFTCGKLLCIDVAAIKRQFYNACNSILAACSHAAENVKLLLVKAYCLPVISYCIGALSLNQVSVKSLSIGLNDVMRKIYGLNRWESAKPIFLYCEMLPFNYLYVWRKWCLLQKCLSVDGIVGDLVRLSGAYDNLCLSLAKDFEVNYINPHVTKGILFDTLRVSVNA